MTIEQTVERTDVPDTRDGALLGQMWLSGSRTGWPGLTFPGAISLTSGG